MARIKPNEEAFRKRKSSKLTLKKVMATLSVVAIMGGTGHFLYGEYTDINVPDGFDYTGTNISSSSYFDYEEEMLKENPSDFVMIEVNDWKKAVTNESIENIKNCNRYNIPCGIILRTKSTNPKEAQADAACIIATIGDNNINCKINYNLDEISNIISNDELIKMCESFIVTFNRQSDRNYEVAFSGTKETLNKLGDNFNENDMLLICKDKDPNYDGEYSSCYFERTGEYYTSNNPIKTNDDEIIGNEKPSEPGQENVGVGVEEGANDFLKGIDVSEFQGDIDWEKVNNEGVKYAIIRFTEYQKFHSTGNLIIDTKFFKNVSECERLGIPYGIYCYTKADTEEEAKLEAKALLDVLNENSINPDLPIYYDIEMKKHFENPKNSSNLCETFCTLVENAGYESGIYASYSIMKQMVESNENLFDYNKWIAYYKNNEQKDFHDITEAHIPEIDGVGRYDLVQVSSNGKVSGITSNTTDVNFYTTAIAKENKK